MDSGAKGFFRKLKRIQFWIICPVVILVGFVAWLLCVSTIAKERDKNLKAIETLYSTLRTEESKACHANDKVSGALEQIIEKRKIEVAEAWTERWNQQANTDVFKWPSELKERLLDKVQGLRPIETTVGFPPSPDMKLAIDLRRNYEEYIKEELPKLAKEIGASWEPGRRRSGGSAFRVGDGGRQVGDGGRRRENNASTAFVQTLVAWDPTNQAQIESTHFEWKNHPGLLDILYAHEDLTVFRSIMDVIRKSNEGAVTRFEAAVKEIRFIRIGSNAAQVAGRVYVAGNNNAAGSGQGDARSADPQLLPLIERRGNPDGQLARDGEQIQAVMAPLLDPADRRYVDKNYEPLSAEQLRAVLKKSESGAPAEAIEPAWAFLAVAKRIPVRMRLRVDQRKLSRVLTECANSELTIDIRQVRINPEESIAVGSRRRQQSRDGARVQQRDRGEELFQYDIDVELYGIIYVYNPVNKSLLGIEEDVAPENPDDSVATRYLVPQHPTLPSLADGSH